MVCGTHTEQAHPADAHEVGLPGRHWRAADAHNVRRANSSALQLAHDCGHGSVHAILGDRHSSRLGLRIPRRAHIRLHSSRPGGRSGEVWSHQVGTAVRRGRVIATHPGSDCSALRRLAALTRARIRPATHARRSRLPPAAIWLGRFACSLGFGLRIWKERRTRRLSGFAAPPNKRIQQARRSARLGGRHRRAADAQMLRCDVRSARNGLHGGSGSVGASMFCTGPSRTGLRQ